MACVLEVAEFPELKRILSRITYKPGWSFDIRRGGPDGFPELRISMLAPDATGRVPGEIPVQTSQLVPPHIIEERDESAFLSWLAWCVADLEIHESHEWLKIDGRCITAPHT